MSGRSLGRCRMFGRTRSCRFGRSMLDMGMGYDIQEVELVEVQQEV